MSRKFLYLLHPDSGNDAGDSAATATGDSEETPGDQGGPPDNAGGNQSGSDNSEDVAKLNEALRKEREVSAAAEKRAKAAEKLVRDAQTSGRTVEERVAFIEKENVNLRLEQSREKAIKAAIAKVENGYVVDREAVDELLSIATLTPDNVSDVVALIVKRNTRPAITLPETQNTQQRSDAASKIDFDTAPDLNDVF